MSEGNLILLNANVITLDSKRPRAEGIAVQNGKILSVGTDHDVSHFECQGTKVIDCKKKTVVPGLVDCHVHMLEFGFFLQQLDLRNTRSIKQMQQQLLEHSAKNPELDWILGGRWDEEKFAEKRYPTRFDLDAAVRNRPVFLSRVCGHLSVANSKALQLAGVTTHTRVKGGEIVLDGASGQPNGVLKDNARDVVWKVAPKPSREARKKACDLACEKAVESGLTGVHWLVSSAEEAQILQTMYSKGKLPLRVYLGIPVEVLDEIIILGLVTGFGNEMLKLGFIKILSDGSLGARTAALKKPYSDDRRKRGMMLYAQKRLERLIFRAHTAGLQLGVHAIGDRAVENALNAFEKILKKSPRKDHRHRIEHCSVLNPKLIRQMKRLNLVASIQPHFVISDFWTANRVGPERARWTYPFKTLAEKGLVLASGSDCPVELISPLLGIWAAASERKDGSGESLTVEDALRTYTLNAAYASFDEGKKGTIQTGKYADFTILSDDVTKVAPDKIRDVKIEMVIVNGKVVYSKE